MKRSTTVLQRRDGSEGSSPTSQTLVRGLDVLEMVARGPVPLPALADRLGLARSTAHRLATALLERRYLTLMPREGYALGPKLLELGLLAREQTKLPRIARNFMEQLAAQTLDTVHLTVRDTHAALLLERIQGHRRLLPCLRIGERSMLTRCAAGRALLIDETDAAWQAMFAQDCGSGCPDMTERARSKSGTQLFSFIEAMRAAASLGYAADIAEDDDPLRTVAAPVRGAGGAVVAALGLSTAAQYLDDDGVAASGRAVCAMAAAISAELGYTDGVRQRNLPPGGLESASPLEAGVVSVHDRKRSSPVRAGEPDQGGAYEA
jgi:DNA-binding IclR family transcriptional regulator